MEAVIEHKNPFLPPGAISKLSVLEIAQACHEVNRAFCVAIGDNSQPAWANAPDWQKDSAVAGVRFHLANPDASASASHESWLEQKAADGWRWGEVKNPDAKEHPCIVPFTELPKDQQAKDFLFRGVVHVLAGIPASAEPA